MIERIVHEGTQLALVLRKSYHRDGIEFFTQNQDTMQLGYMCRPKDYVITPHVHRPVTREVQYTEEVLVLRSGKIRLDFYDEQQTYLRSTVMVAGDIVLLSRGGHGLMMLEASEIVEVKQGPYVGEQDKQRFSTPASTRRGADEHR